MATINVRRDVEDMFYRYKMPKLEAKIEGKGNGIKTVIPNMVNVARALTRPPSYTTKYFGIELGAQVSCDDKNNRYIVNGAHDASKLQDLLDGFIDKFVLCGSCKNPETRLVVSKRDIQRKCGACGKRTQVIPTHRLTTFIQKNPPLKDDNGGQHATADTPGSANGVSSNGSPEDSNQDPIDVQLSTITAGITLNDYSKEAEEKWIAKLDMSAEAIALRQKQLAGGLVESGEVGDLDENTVLGNYIVDEKPEDDEIYAKAKELGIHKKYRALRAVILALFSEAPVQQLIDGIKKHADLLLKFGPESKHQKAAIDSFVIIISEHMDTHLKKTGLIFKALYDEEIVEEETFHQWNKKPSKKHVDAELVLKIHSQAQPFFKWLEEADEESETDDDEDSGSE